MNTFVDAFDNAENVTVTENGCKTYKSSKNANLDFFGMASAMRGKNDSANSLFKAAFAEDKNLALKNAFYCRDIRGGQGERDIFRTCILDLIMRNQLTDDQLLRLISMIPEYGRWDDILFFGKELHENGKDISVILDYIKKQIDKDIKNVEENRSVSLLAKWFPLENNRGKSKKEFAIFVRKNLFNNAEHCRKTIVKIRKYIDVLEQKISANEWDTVEYEKVPSCANKKYANAFKKHDSERYNGFIQKVVNNETTMNSKDLYPYEIVAKCDSMDKNVLEAMWKSLPDYTNGNSAICVVDVSGSMTCNNGLNSILPINVAISLGIYFSERNKSEFRNRFITFSSTPTLVKLSDTDTIVEKVRKVFSSDWGMNTDLIKVFNLYLKLAKKCDKEDLPKSIIIISDMEFDQATRSNKKTAFEKINKMFEEAGIERPSLVFWNVNSSGNNVPVTSNQYGTVLISGASPTIFRMAMANTTPYEFMMSVLGSDRYKNIEIF